MAKVTLNHGEVAKLLKSGGVRAELTRRAVRVLAAAQASAPVKTGNYKAGLKIIQVTTDRAVVRVAGTAPHSHLVESQCGNLARALNAAGGI